MENIRKKIVLVTGMSGAGKSTATRFLEDMGYHVIDNFPVRLIKELVTMIETSSDTRFDHVALSTSAVDFPAFLTNLKGDGIEVQTLFLDATDTVLLRRYKSTRRLHPLLLSNAADSLEEAIDLERRMFAGYTDNAFISLDTTRLTEKEFRTRIEKLFAIGTTPVFSISFISFGYKFGVPLDADLMIDVRFLPNPFWVKRLRHHSGNEKEVYDYVMNKPETKEFMERLLAFTDYAFRKYSDEGKTHFTMAVGCTGGHHRSVAITNYLYEHYRNTYRCYKEHRDEANE